ncbi:MAG: GGDEF domain-containing response regulator [Legionellales bacterium]|nr:GGDEF domain-containing response regulator [Legionellales bacterium]
MSGATTKLIIVGGLQKEREYWQELLENKYPNEFEVFLTDSGKEALSISKNNQPACILLDFCLFDLDGLQLIDLFNKQHPKPGVPIIMLAEPTQKEAAHQALAKGVMHCIVKTKISATTLHRAISEAIKNIALPEEERKKQTRIIGLEQMDDDPVDSIAENTVKTEAVSPDKPEVLIEEEDQPLESEQTEETISLGSEPVASNDPIAIDEIELQIKPASTAPATTASAYQKPAYTAGSSYPNSPYQRPTTSSAPSSSVSPSIKPPLKQPVQTERDLNQLAQQLTASHVQEPPQVGQTDPITGLPNHVLFKSTLERAIAHAARHSRYMALLLFDLHELDAITEQFGEENRNKIICDIVLRFKENLRSHDYIARLNTLGMGEFAVILSEIADYYDASLVARRLLDIIRQPLNLGTEKIQLTASIGIACYPADNHSVMDFHKNAVLAMYYAKQNNGEIYYFNEELNQQHKRRIEIERDLIRGFQQNEFYLCYQPVFNLQTMDIVGLQTEIQWNHPTYHIVNVTEFLAVAEKSNLIIEITQWVFNTIQKAHHELARHNSLPHKLYIKISLRHFQDQAARESLIQFIREGHINSAIISLQIPESLMNHQNKDFLVSLQQLKALGVHLCFTEFGTGMTNLNLLKHKPVDALVVDQTYLRNAHISLSDAAMAKTIINIANNMEMQSIAEKVQNQEQLIFLKDHHCTFAYGDFLCKPLTLEELFNSTTQHSANALRLRQK